MSLLDYQIDALERRMLLSLVPAGPEFRVNSFTTDRQLPPRSRWTPMAISWSRGTVRTKLAPTTAVYAQRHDAVGVPQGPGQSLNCGSDRVVW
jgi:hypothetical protein